MLDYPVILEEQPEGGFVVTFPDVPEAITQGEDENDGSRNAAARGQHWRYYPSGKC
jgi:antitoxin HicB